MAEYVTTDTELTSVANAIRTKGGTSASLAYPTGFVSAIEAISSGTDVSDTTATAADVLSGKYFYNASGTKTQGSIVSRTSSDLTASGATVTVPAGHYASSASKSVANGSATTPATTITAQPSISVNASGLITATNSQTRIVTPDVSAGYVSAGTPGTITVSGSKTSQLPTQAAQTITPTTTDQTIASGKYLTGTQTIKGDPDLVAANIAKGVTIFGVTGTHEGGGAKKAVFRCTGSSFIYSMGDRIDASEFDNCKMVAVWYDSNYGDMGLSFGLNVTGDMVWALTLLDGGGIGNLTYDGDEITFDQELEPFLSEAPDINVICVN